MSSFPKLVRIAALAAMAMTSSTASAQQVATAVPAPNFAACDAIKDPGESAACYTRETVGHFENRIEAAEKRGAVADARIATANTLQACINFLKVKKANGAALAPERLTRETVCNYAAELGMQ